ncbi:MAG TPA: B-box zinc finger protein [Bryobacteraceae bacterium]|nr:B-box zinc finger protein [Bryobacteraceae bacterium]
MPLPKWELAAGEAAVCTVCGSSNVVRVFPAALAFVHTLPAEAALEGEAACFDHPARRAVSACHQCGRYVCPLCSVDFAGLTWCPSCVAAGAGRAKSANPDSSRTLYDSTALILPLASLILYPFTVIAAPASLVLTIMKWRQPLSLVRRSRWRFVAAVLVSLGEIAGWTLLIAYFVSGRLLPAPQ